MIEGFLAFLALHVMKRVGDQKQKQVQNRNGYNLDRLARRRL